MSLRILFADDSVTAQNMGRKILTEAGYEVVAVSNGAAAVKKIAEQKPDIIILDVYMPGYTGLEVCEKVRGSMETMKTPVLLTYGKLEHYKAEDGNRVKADGVIVKPFEASDLLAIVKKFEERIGQVPVLVQQPTLRDSYEDEETAETAVEAQIEHPARSVTFQPMVEVPDHMATTAAFSDLLASEPAAAGNHFAEPTPPPPPPPPTPPPVLEMPVLETPVLGTPAQATIPDYELPATWREPEHLEAEIPVTAAVPEPSSADSALEPGPPLEPEPEPVPPPPPAPSVLAARPLQIPVYQEPDAAESGYELMPTSAPPLGEIELPREPHLQETAAEATRNTVADSIEPGLLSTGRQFEPASVSPEAIEAAELAPVEEEFAPAGFQDIPAEITAHQPLPKAASPETAAEPVADSFSDADFEARVAAALSAYGHHGQAASASQPSASDFAAAPNEGAGIPVAPAASAVFAEETPGPETREIPPAWEVPGPAVEFEPHTVATSETAEFEAQDLRSASFEPAVAAPAEEFVPAAEPAPESEYRPPVGASPLEPVEAPSSIAHSGHHTYEAAAPAEMPPREPHAAEDMATDAFVASIEDALPAMAAEHAGPGTDHQAIAQAVHRVMERLKPELVEEILRELKSKKD